MRGSGEPAIWGCRCKCGLESRLKDDLYNAFCNAHISRINAGKELGTLGSAFASH